MKDVRAVLCQKEKDAERVRREIQALLTVIPLLADGEVVSEDVRSATDLPTGWEELVRPPENDMAALQTYYPFVRHLGLPKRP